MSSLSGIPTQYDSWDYKEKFKDGSYIRIHTVGLDLHIKKFFAEWGMFCENPSHKEVFIKIANDVYRKKVWCIELITSNKA